MKKLLAASALSVILVACSSPYECSHHGPKGRPHSPELEAAMKECHESVGQSRNMARFDDCMKEKGFEKPAGHPPMRGHAPKMTTR